VLAVENSTCCGSIVNGAESNWEPVFNKNIDPTRSVI
jgi:hypothetical protein